VGVATELNLVPWVAGKLRGNRQVVLVQGKSRVAGRVGIENAATRTTVVLTAQFLDTWMAFSIIFTYNRVISGPKHALYVLSSLAMHS
jgi:hypothetical protein